MAVCKTSHCFSVLGLGFIKLIAFEITDSNCFKNVPVVIPLPFKEPFPSGFLDVLKGEYPGKQRISQECNSLAMLVSRNLFLIEHIYCKIQIEFLSTLA